MNQFWISFVAAALAAYPIYRLLLLTKSRQTIDPHAPETHMVKQGTPTMGGLIVAFGFFAALIGSWVPEFIAPAIIFAGFMLIGFVDDFVVPKLIKKRGLGWLPKLAMQFAVAGAGAYLGLTRGFPEQTAMRGPYFTNGFEGSYVTDGSFPLAFAFVAFCILFFANAYNFLDGLDALSGSVFLALAIGLSVFFPMLTGAIAGGILAFLFLNAPPAKVFMGDVGSLPIGGVIGFIVGTALWIKPSLVPNFAALTAILVLELALVPIQVGFYKLTKKRIFRMAPIHHAFEKLGWKETRVVWTFCCAQLVLSMASISLAPEYCWAVMGLAYASVLLILNPKQAV